ncbi:MAG: hypothetical protein ACM30I_15655 [Gemmatimonas sp.]
MRHLAMAARLVALIFVIAVISATLAVAQPAPPTNEQLLKDFGTLVRGFNLSQLCRVYDEDLNNEFMSYIVNAKTALDSRVTKPEEDAVVQAARADAANAGCSPATGKEVNDAYSLAQRLTALLYPKGDDPQATVRFRIKDAFVRWGMALHLDDRCSQLSGDDRAFLTSAYKRMADLMPKAQWRPDEIAKYEEMTRSGDRRPCGPATATSLRQAVEHAHAALRQ